MAELFELRLEVPVIVPDKPAIVTSRLKEAIGEAAVDSGVEEIVVEGKLEPTLGQLLPTKEEVDVILAVVGFAIQQAPTAWPHLKVFLEQLQARLHKTTPIKIKAEITIGKKKISVKELTPDDTFRLITKEYEVHFKPRPQG
jgi:hypothetical protein